MAPTCLCAVWLSDEIQLYESICSSSLNMADPVGNDAWRSSLKRVESEQKMDRTVQRESRQSLSTAHALLEKCMERRFLKEQIKLVMRDECLMLNSLYCVYIY